MPVLHPVRGLFLHFRKHITYYPGGVVGCLGGAGSVDRDVGEGGPREGVVEVVFEEVVLGEIGEVRLLYVGDVGGVEGPDVHVAIEDVDGVRGQ